MTYVDAEHDRKLQRPQNTAPDAKLFRSLVGRSGAIAEVRSRIHRIAPSDATVLVLGETGTGKEVLARNIHYHSARRSGPFVAVNCSAIPVELLESELFGHEMGLLRGALTARQGRFDLARGGTLFLDEVGEMGRELQGKLLRVLQEQLFGRVGGTRSITADVRIVAATHRNLEKCTEAGHFREDLYCRLNLVPIRLPPLRERIEDIPLLIAELDARLSARQLRVPRIGEDVLHALLAYEWPGNLREFANLIERFAILIRNRDVDLRDLPPGIRDCARGETVDGQIGREVISSLADHRFNAAAFEAIDLTDPLEALELRLILQALERSGGIVGQAAQSLGLRRTTLIDRIRRFGVERLATSPANP